MLDDEYRDLVARMFALLTMKFEDAAGLAVDGQNRRGHVDTLACLARQLQNSADEISIVAEVTQVLIEGEVGGDRNSC